MPQREDNTSTSEIHFGACSDVGNVRSENQDAYGQFLREDEEERLFVVADGMGGHRRGREASREALRVISETYFRESGPDVEQRLERAFRTANMHVYEQVDSEQPAEKMGTTCTALVLAGDRAFIGHVGDSRAYRLRGPALEQLTQDHTAVAEMQREGVLTDAEAQNHPRRHILSRALGIEPVLEVDVLVLQDPRPGDCFLLCTDGLLSVPERDLIRAMRTQNPQSACEALVQQANRRDGRDNVTALLIRFDDRD